MINVSELFELFKRDDFLIVHSISKHAPESKNKNL